MKSWLINIAIGIVVINVFGMTLCTGESFPIPKPVEHVKYTTRSAYP